MRRLRILAAAILVTSSAESFGASMLSEAEIAKSKDYSSLILRAIKKLKFDSKSGAYYKDQSYDLIVGYGDLKKPKIYADKFCKLKGGMLAGISKYPPPTLSWEHSSVNSSIEKSLNDSFGLFSCQINSNSSWYVDIMYSEPRKSTGLFSGLYATQLIIKSMTPTQYQEAAGIKAAKVIEEKSNEAGKRLDAIKKEQDFIEQRKREYRGNLKIGASVCYDSHPSNYSEIVVRQLGTVEQVAGEKIKVFFEAAQYVNGSNLTPGGFQQHYSWGEYWNFTPCKIYR